MCHSDCALLDVGPLRDLFVELKTWLDDHPREVLTLLIGNSDRLSPTNFTEIAQQSKLMDVIYTPPHIPMKLNDWPTLQEMIAANSRIVVMLDYQANETSVPWLLDEFRVLTETKF